MRKFPFKEIVPLSKLKFVCSLLSLLTAIKGCLSEFGLFSIGRALSSPPTPYQVQFVVSNNSITEVAMLNDNTVLLSILVMPMSWHNLDWNANCPIPARRLASPRMD